MTGMEMSMTTTSGRCATVTATPSAPLLASPTTSMSGSALINAVRPTRTTM